MPSESSESANDGTANANAEECPKQQSPPMKKRGASRQITKDDYDDDDSNNKELPKQGFKRASDEVLSARKIYKVKRDFATPKTAEAGAKKDAGATPVDKSSKEKEVISSLDNDNNSSASTTPAVIASGSSNPFASTVLTSPTEKLSETGTTTKKIFGFGSATGFNTSTSGLSTGMGSSSFGGGRGFAGVGTNGKPSGFGLPSSSASGSSSGFVFGASSSSMSGAGGGTTKNLFGKGSGSSTVFSLSNKGNDSADIKSVDANKTTRLPDKVDLKTGEEDEEAIHSGRCKSFEWVIEDSSDEMDGDLANGDDHGDDGTSSNKKKDYLSVQSSTQFQSAISSSKQKSTSIGSSNNGKSEKSVPDATKQNDAGTTNSKTSATSVKHRWMELGIGPVKILRSKSNPERLRLVQRRESSKMGPATKVILNVPLWRESTCERDRQAQQYLRLKTMKEGKMCQYSLKFKENADAGYFHHHLTDQIPLARQCFSEAAAENAGKTGEIIAAQQK